MLEGYEKAKPVRRFFANNENCIEYLKYKRWKGGNAWCIHCEHDKVYELLENKYKCAKCKTKFSLLSGTIFEDTHLPLSDWFDMILDMCKGVSTGSQLYKEYEISEKSIWFARHRIQQLFLHDFDSRVPEKGVWEFDEIYIGVMESKMSKEKIVKKEKIAGFGHRTPILAFYNRNTRELFGKVIPVHAGKELTQEIIKKVIHPESVIYCDKSSDYSGLLEYFSGGKQFIHKIKNYGGGKDHSNTIEGSFMHFRAMLKSHIQLPAKYLQRYWYEFCFRYNCNRKKVNVVDAFDLAMNNIERPISKEELMEVGEEVNKMISEAKAKKGNELNKQKLKRDKRERKKIVKHANDFLAIFDCKTLNKKKQKKEL